MRGSVSDRLAVSEVLDDYARGIDSKDWDLVVSCFFSDALLDYSAFGCPMGMKSDEGKMSMLWTGGAYNDRLERTDEGWKIVRRIFEKAWMAPGPDATGPNATMVKHADVLRRVFGQQVEIDVVSERHEFGDSRTAACARTGGHVHGRTHQEPVRGRDRHPDHRPQPEEHGRRPSVARIHLGQGRRDTRHQPASSLGALRRRRIVTSVRPTSPPTRTRQQSLRAPGRG